MTPQGMLHPAWLRPVLIVGAVAIHAGLFWTLSPRTRPQAGVAPPIIEMVQAEAEAAAPEQPVAAEAAPRIEPAPAMEETALAEPPPVEPVQEERQDQAELPPELPPAPSPEPAQLTPPLVAQPAAPAIPVAQPPPERPRDTEVERRAEQRRIERERVAEAQRREREDQRRRKRDEERRQALARPPRELSTGAAPSDAGRPAQAGGNVSAAAYASQVHRILQSRTTALGLNARGNVSVSFAIDASGRMAASGIIRSSGDDSVDHAIRTMLARSSFPAPPSGRFSGSVTIRIQ